MYILSIVPPKMPIHKTCGQRDSDETTDDTYISKLDHGRCRWALQSWHCWSMMIMRMFLISYHWCWYRKYFHYYYVMKVNKLLTSKTENRSWLDGLLLTPDTIICWFAVDDRSFSYTPPLLSSIWLLMKMLLVSSFISHRLSSGNDVTKQSTFGLTVFLTDQQPAVRVWSLIVPFTWWEVNWLIGWLTEWRMHAYRLVALLTQVRLCCYKDRLDDSPS